MIATADAPVTSEVVAREIPCESIYHESGKWGHAGPAEWLMLSPCGHGSGHRCDRFAQRVLARPGLSICDLCGNTDDVTFIPLSIHSETDRSEA